MLGRVEDLATLLRGPWRRRDDAPDHLVIRSAPPGAFAGWDTAGIAETGLALISLLPLVHAHSPGGADALPTHESLAASARAVGIEQVGCNADSVTAAGRTFAKLLLPLDGNPSSEGLTLIWIASPPWSRDPRGGRAEPDSPEGFIRAYLEIRASPGH